MPRKIPVPCGWNRRTKAAILQILALSHHSFTALFARARIRRSGCDSGPVNAHSAALLALTEGALSRILAPYGGTEPKVRE